MITSSPGLWDIWSHWQIRSNTGNSIKHGTWIHFPCFPNTGSWLSSNRPGVSLDAVKELIFRKDVSDIIIATDAGRERELVARWILDKAGNQKPLKRLWISSVTDKAIREGFQNLRPGKSYEPLYRAAVARAQSDWVVGINATRALTCKYNAQLSCGRVQTPTLAMIAAREEEISHIQTGPLLWTQSSGRRDELFMDGSKIRLRPFL